ncbi:DUF1579 family protein [Arthrobacter sp. TES]|uniref:DUF1579 family protein n=1 Tax=Paenarthrobacter TaxID=1742992 RepID=UPI000397F854|nr:MULTISPECIES: DUF1579 family protein [Paenarthrobacter]AMB39964.1 hypothetical protein AUT26_06885 [Arthrobacter sp. ATCC 21022]AOY71940.1 hypothetical protein ARZXY2_2409 [Arthrobacter sp. ZXY-2]ERI37483.1 hypothetical protein M707_11695 [Arthrobacter sp. AK-YN10]QOI63740.1 DUF1579 family protein [Arthrobacter sp. TES]BCW83706.1 hypothetical protein NicSoilE8_13790 [Arthrobacter sp. NicSoilE8]
MDTPKNAAEVLRPFLGRWRGITEIASSAWGPARTAEAEAVFTAAAGGHAVVQSYRHKESGGAHLEGHGMFTVDPTHGGTLWYYVDSHGQAPSAPVRGHWTSGTLGFERRTADGVARHTFRVEEGTLVHTAELRLEGRTAFSPLLKSVFRKA